MKCFQNKCDVSNSFDLKSNAIEASIVRVRLYNQAKWRIKKKRINADSVRTLENIVLLNEK